MEKLIPVKWAFNSKPDIMIVSNSIVLLIEVKFESGEGHDRESGYQQLEVQELISILVRMLRPDYQDMKFINTSLEVNAEMGLSWSEVLPFIEQSDVDDFSKLCMSQLQRF